GSITARPHNSLNEASQARFLDGRDGEFFVEVGVLPHLFIEQPLGEGVVRRRPVPQRHGLCSVGGSELPQVHAVASSTCCLRNPYSGSIGTSHATIKLGSVATTTQTKNQAYPKRSSIYPDTSPGSIM